MASAKFSKKEYFLIASAQRDVRCNIRGDFAKAYRKFSFIYVLAKARFLLPASLHLKAEAIYKNIKAEFYFLPKTEFLEMPLK